MLKKEKEMDTGAGSYRRFLSGDRNGMVEIIRDYKDGLTLYLNGLTGNIHTAEELMEETFVKLVVKKPRFSEKYSFKTWLYTIGRNVAIDYLRKYSRVINVDSDEMERVFIESESPEQAYIRDEDKLILHRAMSALNPDYRQVLYLAYFEDFSNAQIAHVMKKNTRQIENLLYRAKLSLKSQLNKEGFVYEKL